MREGEEREREREREAVGVILQFVFIQCTCALMHMCTPTHNFSGHLVCWVHFRRNGQRGNSTTWKRLYLYYLVT